MNRLFVVGLLVFGIYYMGIGSIGIIRDIRDGNTALVLQGISESELNTTIIDHYTNVVLNAAQAITPDDIRTIATDLNNDGAQDVIAIMESSATCGSGGCIASIFMKNEEGELRALNFEYAVKHIEVLESITLGMHDLRVNHDEAARMIWNGSVYVREEI